jgi:O-antigen ligase
VNCLAVGALLAGAAYVTGVATNYITALTLGQRIDVEVVMLGYRNPRFPSATHAVLIPLIRWLAMPAQQRKSVRLVALVVATLLWAINLALATRGIWVATAVAAFALSWVGSRSMRKLILLVVGTAAAGLAIYWIFFHAIPSFLVVGESLQSRSGDIASLSLRERLWVAAIKMALQHPWLGAGPMHFATDPGLKFAHPHSWPLQVACEWGMPALIAVSFLLSSHLVRCFRLIDEAAESADREILVPIYFAAVIGLTYGLFDGNWVMPVSQSLNVIVLGSLIGLFPRTGTSSRPASVRVLAGIGVISSLCLVWFSVTSLPHQSALEDRYRKFTVQVDFAPRFWQQGFINFISGD